MRIIIEIEDGQARVQPEADQGQTHAARTGGAAEGGGDSGGGTSDRDRVPADLAVRAAMVGARSAGPAPTSEELGLGAAGAPGFPPEQVGAPRAMGANAPTSATPEDTSAGAAPGVNAGPGEGSGTEQALDAAAVVVHDADSDDTESDEGTAGGAS